MSGPSWELDIREPQMLTIDGDWLSCHALRPRMTMMFPMIQFQCSVANWPGFRGSNTKNRVEQRLGLVIVSSFSYLYSWVSRRRASKELGEQVNWRTTWECDKNRSESLEIIHPVVQQRSGRLGRSLSVSSSWQQNRWSRGELHSKPTRLKPGGDSRTNPLDPNKSPWITIIIQCPRFDKSLIVTVFDVLYWIVVSHFNNGRKLNVDRFVDPRIVGCLLWNYNSTEWASKSTKLQLGRLERPSQLWTIWQWT